MGHPVINFPVVGGDDVLQGVDLGRRGRERGARGGRPRRRREVRPEDHLAHRLLPREGAPRAAVGYQMITLSVTFPFIQGDPSGRLKPLVDFVLTALAANGPLL